MKARVINNIKIEFSEDGFLRRPELWNEEVAFIIAADIGMGTLSEKHWEVVYFIRDYWAKNKNAPLIRNVCESCGLRLAQINELFPTGAARGACRIAGLPKPEGCV